MNVAAAAAERAGRTGFRRLMVSLGLASGALSALFAGAGTVLLAQQVENSDPSHKVAVLGVIAGVSAAFALVFNPVGGALSDRTRSRLGRRAPWLLGAPAALLIVLAWLGHSRTVPVILAAWCLAQSVVNLYQAPLTAVICAPAGAAAGHAQPACPPRGVPVRAHAPGFCLRLRQPGGIDHGVFPDHRL